MIALALILVLTFCTLRRKDIYTGGDGFIGTSEYLMNIDLTTFFLKLQSNHQDNLYESPTQ
jgi:hypothetical protein